MRDYGSDPIRIGVVGAGIVGQLAHIANFNNLEYCRVVGIAELREGLRDRVKAKYDIPRGYASHVELLADPDIEAVVVITMRSALGPIVCDALRAGKHVFSEKPLAHNTVQAEEVLALARAQNRHLRVGYMKRYDPGVVAVQNMLKKDEVTDQLGCLRSISVSSHGGDFWRHCKEFEMTDEPKPKGLALWDTHPTWLESNLRAGYADFANVFIHALNMIRLFAPADLQIHQSRFSSPVAGRIELFSGKIPVQLVFSNKISGDWRERYELFFDHSTITIDMPAPMDRNACAQVSSTPGLDALDIPIDALTGWAFHKQAGGFIDLVASDKDFAAGFDDPLDDIKVVEDIWRNVTARPGHFV